MSRIGLRPLFERVIIELEPTKSTTSGGIMLAEDAREMPVRGKVIAIGPNAIEGTNNFEEDDIVLIMKYAGLTYTHKGKSYQVIMKNDIIAVVDEEK